ncbi:hypothetical protein EYC58_03645 [Candidatus Saccharibacteria bacterium]|nr:MAG: hypothetical protein EYC58_03645 [Candidatus Saccharibacteria bacterium]
MNTLTPGKTATAAIQEGVIEKNAFPGLSFEAAERYVNDVITYDDALRANDFLVPALLRVFPLRSEDGSYSVVQVSDVVNGYDLDSPHADRLSAMQDAIRLVVDSPVDRHGNMHVPVDAKPANFMTDGHLTYFVDTLPPLVAAGRGEFPYHYMSNGARINHEWVDRYVRSQTGAAARFIGMGLRNDITHAPRILTNRGRLDNHLEELFAKVDDGTEKSKIITETRKKVVPFMGFTVLRAGYNRLARR